MSERVSETLFCISMSLSTSAITVQVLLTGGTEAPTKPKGRPKKSSLENPDDGPCNKRQSEDASGGCIDVTESLTSEIRVCSDMSEVNSPGSSQQDEDIVCDDVESDAEPDDVVTSSMAVFPQ